MTRVIEQNHVEIFESAFEIVTDETDSTIIQNIVDDAKSVLEEMKSLEEGEIGSVPSRKMDSARTVLALAARCADDDEKETVFFEKADWFVCCTYGSWPKPETTDFIFRKET